MKTFRLLLATFSLAALAACGTESITGPGSHAPGARRNVTPVEGDTTTTQSTSSSGTGTTCDGTVVVTTDPSGNVTVSCTARGPVVGSGS
jgi:predicted small lipoprotein YifL